MSYTAQNRSKRGCYKVIEVNIERMKLHIIMKLAWSWQPQLHELEFSNFRNVRSPSQLLQGSSRGQRFLDPNFSLWLLRYIPLDALSLQIFEKFFKNCNFLGCQSLGELKFSVWTSGWLTSYTAQNRSKWGCYKRIEVNIERLKLHTNFKLATSDEVHELPNFMNLNFPTSEMLDLHSALTRGSPGLKILSPPFQYLGTSIHFSRCIISTKFVEVLQKL